MDIRNNNHLDNYNHRNNIHIDHCLHNYHLDNTVRMSFLLKIMLKQEYFFKYQFHFIIV
jgi:hypothetical protein